LFISSLLKLRVSLYTLIGYERLESTYVLVNNITFCVFDPTFLNIINTDIPLLNEFTGISPYNPLLLKDIVALLDNPELLNCTGVLILNKLLILRWKYFYILF
jgi:hypothetical protein